MTSETSPDSDHKELWREAYRLVNEGGVGILSTCGADGRPHATWMGSVGAPPDLSEIFTITAPNTEKIKNLRENPRAEWMFHSRCRESIVYLSGDIEIIASERDRLDYWNRVPNKSQAFFLNYYERTKGFAVLRMRVDHIVFCKPMAFRKILLKGNPG